MWVDSDESPQSMLRARIAGKYEVERVLGEGGMGTVVAAMHVALGRRFAIKRLRVSPVGDSEAAYKRFAREARIGAELRNRHTAAVHDFGVDDDGTPYIVMDYLEGITLRDLLARGPVPVIDAIDYVLQACDALEEAHALGIVHRDLTPSNLFLTQRDRGIGTVKVLDFGVAKLIEDPSGGALTRTRSFIGSPLYMAPEQMQSARDVDRRADIWSLGAILHELVTGMPAFRGATLPEACLAVVSLAPKPLCALRSDVPRALEELVLRCLSKDREARPPTVGAVREELVAIRRNLDIGNCDTIRAAVFPSVPASARPEMLVAPAAQTMRRRGRAMEALVLVALVGVALVAYSGQRIGAATVRAQRAVATRIATARVETPSIDVLRASALRGVTKAPAAPAASPIAPVTTSPPTPSATRDAWRWGGRE